MIKIRHNTENNMNTTRICQNCMNKKNTYQNLYNILNTTFHMQLQMDTNIQIIRSSVKYSKFGISYATTNGYIFCSVNIYKIIGIKFTTLHHQRIHHIHQH